MAEAGEVLKRLRGKCVVASTWTRRRPKMDLASERRRPHRLRRHGGVRSNEVVFIVSVGVSAREVFKVTVFSFKKKLVTFYFIYLFFFCN